MAHGIVGCTPTNVVLWKIPIQALYHVSTYVFFHPQESLENTINTMVLLMAEIRLTS